MSKAYESLLDPSYTDERSNAEIELARLEEIRQDILREANEVRVGEKVVSDEEKTRLAQLALLATDVTHDLGGAAFLENVAASIQDATLLKHAKDVISEVTEHDVPTIGEQERKIAQYIFDHTTPEVSATRAAIDALNGGVTEAPDDVRFMELWSERLEQQHAEKNTSEAASSDIPVQQSPDSTSVASAPISKEALFADDDEELPLAS